MGGQNNRAKAVRKADRARLVRQLKKSQKAGGGYNNDPGGHRQTAIAKLWESLVSDRKY